MCRPLSWTMERLALDSSLREQLANAAQESARIYLPGSSERETARGLEDRSRVLAKIWRTLGNRSTLAPS